MCAAFFCPSTTNGTGNVTPPLDDPQKDDSSGLDSGSGPSSEELEAVQIRGGHRGAESSPDEAGPLPLVGGTQASGGEEPVRCSAP